MEGAQDTGRDALFRAIFIENTEPSFLPSFLNGPSIKEKDILSHRYSLETCLQV